jgi:hypothetical protein
MLGIEPRRPMPGYTATRGCLHLIQQFSLRGSVLFLPTRLAAYCSDQKYQFHVLLERNQKNRTPEALPGLQTGARAGRDQPLNGVTTVNRRLNSAEHRLFTFSN